jgi:hypothetical protein
MGGIERGASFSWSTMVGREGKNEQSPLGKEDSFL